MTLSHPSVPASARQQAATQIVERLRAAGHAAYFAGGCVRDLLLGREPLDFDVATSATPEQVLAMFPRTFAVGAQFGVVLVVDAYDDSGNSDRGGDLPQRWRLQGWPHARSLSRTRIRPNRMFCVATSPSTACCSIRKNYERQEMSTKRCSILLAAGKTCNEASSAPLAIPASDLRKTSCACCARFVSRRDLDLRLKIKRCARFGRPRRRSSRSAGSVCAKN